MVLHTTHILIVDDDEDQREVYRRFLTRNNPGKYSIGEAESEEEAIEQFQEQPVDCILLDYLLPGRNGLDILSHLRELDENAPVVMLTGHGSESVAVEAMKRGALDYLVKDSADYDALQVVVDRAVQKGRLLKQLADQHQELENFGRILAHDLRSPLSGTIGMLHLIRDDVAENKLEKIPEMLDLVINTSEHMMNLITDLSNYNQGGVEIQPVCVGVRDILEQASTNVQPLVEQQGAIISITCDEETVLGDSTQLIQLVQNFIANGIKYNNSIPPTIQVSARVQGDKTSIVIKDNGIGIDSQDLPKIFSPFVRLHKHGAEGTGLGLATCKRIIDRHNGKLDVESEVDSGTVFTISLPAC